MTMSEGELSIKTKMNICFLIILRYLNFVLIVTSGIFKKKKEKKNVNKQINFFITNTNVLSKFSCQKTDKNRKYQFNYNSSYNF